MLRLAQFGPGQSRLFGTALNTLPGQPTSLDSSVRDALFSYAEADYALPIWAGVLPIRSVVDAPIPDPRRIGDHAGIESSI